MNYKLTVKKVACALSVLILCSLFVAVYAGNGKGNAPAQLKIEIKQIDAQRAVVIKVTVASSELMNKMGELYGKLFSYLGTNNITPAGPPFAVYYEYNPQGNVTFEAGVPVSATVKDNDEIKYKEYPDMKVVSTLYVGSYDKMASIYESIQKYIKDNNLQQAGATWEIYLTNPQEEQDTSKYQTVIYFPVK
jgi:effector-binding domain-containing protein